MNNKTLELYAYDKEYQNKGYKYLAGCDEAGRGPMAGPLVVASCILGDNYIDGIRDSKKISSKKREELEKIIKDRAIDYKIVFINEKDVDKLNVYQASKKGMIDCVRGLSKVDYVLTDAMPINFEYPTTSIIRGDDTSAAIAAASILAKTARDRFMVLLDKEYPMYGFINNKGYCTKVHMAAIEKYGICKYHRTSFAPVRKIIERDNNGIKGI